MKQSVTQQSLLPRGRASLSRYLFVAIVATVSWIETAKGSNTCKLLDQQLGLSAEQHQICLGTGGAELLLSVGQARTQDFPEECQYWMGTERWNCSGISMPVFAHSLKSPTSWVHKLTKETAYVQALTSGLLLHRVVRDCSDNKIPGCSCISLSDPLPSDEEWRSCNHNVGYGIQFTKKFLDTMWSKDQQVVQATSGDYQPPVSEKLIHLHNLEAGRRAVTQNQVKHCRCHGMTTSCQLKTCHRELPDERRIGQILKEQYDRAQEVEVVREQDNLPYELVKADYLLSSSEYPFPDHTHLVYQEESPDYCSANSSYGSTGVSGRECVQEINHFTGPLQIGLCREVCCSAGWHPRIVNVERVCKCILRPNSHDCNEVCAYQETKYFCN